MKYPLNLEHCYEICKKSYKENGKEFNEAARDFVKLTVDIINDAYYFGFSEGVKNNNMKKARVAS